MDLNQKKKNSQLTLILLFGLVAVCTGYRGIDASAQPFLGLLFLQSIQFGIYGAIAFLFHRGKSFPFSWILLAGIACRAILWFSEPILENDYWRYLWDGRVLAHGINPYRFAPLDSALDALTTDYRAQIGWPHYRTIYPPFAEILFALSYFLAPDSLLGLKVFLTFFDLGTGLILALWLRESGRNPAWSFLYFLNPLVLKEIANSAHLDSIPVFFSTLALFLFTRASWQRPNLRRWAWIALALATGSKLYALVLVPLFAKLDPQWKRGVLLFAAILVFLYLPFLGAGWNLLGGTGAYAKYWIFNAGIFKVLSVSLNSIISWISLGSGAESIYPFLPSLEDALRNDYPAKLVAGIAFLFLLVQATLKICSLEQLPRFSLIVIGWVLLLSPVVDAWYVLWILPFAVLEFHLAWLAFSYLVVAAYAWFHSKDQAVYYRSIEYIVFWGLLLYWYWRARRPVGITTKQQSKNPPTITE